MHKITNSTACSLKVHLHPKIMKKFETGEGADPRKIQKGRDAPYVADKHNQENVL